MQIIAVDDEKLALENILSAIDEALPGVEVTSFRKGKEALAFAKDNQIDIAFLDIEMRDMDGISLAKDLKLVNPKVNIIFTTGYSAYTGEAMSMHASGYVMKPVTAEKIKHEVEDLRHAIEEEIPINKSSEITARAFGSFEIFANGEPMKFSYNKSKELLAYLIDRKGAMCTTREICDVLWEDDDPDQHASYIKNLRKDLRTAFEAVGAEDALIIQWGKLGVSPSHIACDYFDWIDGKVSGINAYHGEYMTQYSWAEFTHAMLDMESGQYDD